MTDATWAEVFKGVSCAGTGERGLPLPMDGGNWFLLVCNVITVSSLTGRRETDRCKIWNENCSNEVRAQTIIAASYHTYRPSLTDGPGLHSLVINCWTVHLFCLNQHCHNIPAIIIKISQRHLRYIEWKGVKIYDFQKATFSTIFKLYIAGLGVLIPKRYHMLG